MHLSEIWHSKKNDCRLSRTQVNKVGLIAGIFFGLMFGLGGLGSAFFGWLADKTSIEFIFQVSAFLPLLGIIAGFLPNMQKK